MPELLHPGVYVQEVSSGVRPIEGVSTSTAAFVGVADKGPVPHILPDGRRIQPVMVTSFTDYARQFGGFRRDSLLTYAARAFFENGGRRLYIVRVAPTNAIPATLPALSPPSPGTSLPIQATSPGAWGNNIWIAVDQSSDRDPNNFKLLVMYGKTLEEARTNVVETYDNITVRSATLSDPIPSNYVQRVVNSRSEYIIVTADITTMPSLLVTSPPSPPSPRQLADGSDGSGTVDFIGLPGEGTGLYALDKLTDVNLIAIPGQGDIGTINAGMGYCKNERQLQDCFFIADVGSVDSVDDARQDNPSADVRRVSDARDFATTGVGGSRLDKSAGDFGAIYFPWVLTDDPIGAGRNPRILVPPSSFVAGIYARTDNSRGVFKAPAGLEAGVAGALAVPTTVSDTEQDRLNPISVNVIRTVATSGFVVWGTRTIGSNPEWRYVPVRRMAIFLRVSIYYGIQWAVFEPNDEPLWASLRLNIRAFMLTQFRAGAFQGSKPDDAFFVKCDSSTTTQQDIDNGVVNILVGFAPLKPAEFVVLKLSQKVNQPAT
jgi:phage tail sheath protein FI